MKKLLSVVLAVIMLIPIGVTAFALEQPEIPAPAEGVVTFAAESMYVEAGQTYQIPVYIVSNYIKYDSEIAQDLVESVKFELVPSLSGNAAASATITSDLSITVIGTADLLKQEKYQVATVTIVIAEDFAGGEAVINLDLAVIGGAVTGAEGLPLGVITADECTTVSAVLYEHPHWTTILHDWVSETRKSIIDFFTVVLQLLRSLINGDL